MLRAPGTVRGLHAELDQHLHWLPADVALAFPAPMLNPSWVSEPAVERARPSALPPPSPPGCRERRAQSHHSARSGGHQRGLQGGTGPAEGARGLRRDPEAPGPEATAPEGPGPGAAAGGAHPGASLAPSHPPPGRHSTG